MAISFNDNIKVSANKPIDFKFGPFDDIAQANSLIPIAQRYQGLIFGIYVDPLNPATSDIEYYYYWSDLSDTTYKRLLLDQDQLDAINNSNSANSTNPFVTVSDLSAFTGTGNRVIFGGVPQWSGTGLTFDTPYIGYVISGTYYEAGPGTLTLTAADPTDPRRDRFYVDATGWGFITGTPLAIPIAPAIDIITQIDRGEVLINAGATTPVVTNINVYLENTEWTTSSGGSGTFDPNSTAQPFAGTKSFEVTNISAGGYMEFTNVSDVNFADVQSLGFQLYLKNGLRKGRNIVAQFLDVSNNLVGASSGLSFIKTQFGSYQFVSVDFSSIIKTGSSFRKIRLIYTGSGGPTVLSGYYVDNVILQAGVTPPPTGDFVESVTGGVVDNTDPRNPIVNANASLGTDINAALTGSAAPSELNPFATVDDIKPPVNPDVDTYVDTAEMIADQGNQLNKYIYQAGTSFYKYKGTTVGDITDYDIVGSGATSPTLGAEPVQEKFTYTSPDPQTFVVAGTPNGQPELYLNGQFIDWTFWTWNAGTKTATFTGGTLIDQSKIVLAYYSNLSGTAVGDAPNDGQQYGRQNLGWTVIEASAGGGLELIPFSTVINMDGNYKSTHTQVGAIAITKGTFIDPEINFENKTVQLIAANGTGGKPTFTADFVVQMDTWSNNTGDINQLIYKGSPSGKILVWMDNVELA